MNDYDTQQKLRDMSDRRARQKAIRSRYGADNYFNARLSSCRLRRMGAIQKTNRLIDVAGCEDAFYTILRAECDSIMTIIGADEEQTYDGLAEAVKVWGMRQFADGIICGRDAGIYGRSEKS